MATRATNRPWTKPKMVSLEDGERAAHLAWNEPRPPLAGPRPPDVGPRPPLGPRPRPPPPRPGPPLPPCNKDNVKRSIAPSGRLRRAVNPLRLHEAVQCAHAPARHSGTKCSERGEMEPHPSKNLGNQSLHGIGPDTKRIASSHDVCSPGRTAAAAPEDAGYGSVLEHPLETKQPEESPVAERGAGQRCEHCRPVVSARGAMGLQHQFRPSPSYM